MGSVVLGLVIGAAACSESEPGVASNSDAGADSAVISTDSGDGVGPSAGELDAVLEPIRAKAGVPALTAAAYRGGKLLGRGAVGTRKQGGEEAVTLDDRWHLGSDTKAMTATLAAILVEEGLLDWNKTLLDLLPDVPMDPGFASVTFEALLYHRAGLPPNLSQSWMVAASTSTDLVKSRKDAAIELLIAKPAQKPGTYIYSNAGYIVAGAILESLAKESWETLMKKRIFDKLGMASCGFGPPAAEGSTDAPWGHSGKKGAYVPVAPGVRADNPRPLGPAGTVHCTLADWSKFAHAHARGTKDDGGLVSKASFTKLQTPAPDGDYAMGWGVVAQSWAGGKALSHSGSNTMFYATVWVAPEKDLVLLAATNAGDDAAAEAVDAAFLPLIEAYAK